MLHSTLRRALNFFFICIFLASLVTVQPGQAASISPHQTGPTQAGQLLQPPPPGLRTGYNSQTGKVNFIGGSPDAPLSATAGLSALSITDKGDAVLARYAPSFGVTNPGTDLSLERRETNARGTVLRYRQQFRGIPVLGGELQANSDERGNIISLNGEVSPDLDLPSVQPAIPADKAASLAAAGMQEWYRLAPEQITAGQPSLWIYDERIFKPSQKPVTLVWKLEIAANRSVPVNELVLVDAQTGQVALHFNQVDTSWSLQDEPPDPASTPEAEQASTPEVQPDADQQPAPVEDALPQSGKTWYVAPSGSDANTCDTPATPCAKIGAAVSKSASGDAIKAAAGIYKDGFSVNKSVDISGGWDPDFTAQTGFTTLSGSGNTCAIYTFSTITAALSRFEITNMMGSSTCQGAAISVGYNVTLTVRDSFIHDMQSAMYSAAAIYAGEASSLTLVNTTISDGEVRGIYAYGAKDITLQNVTIARNQSINKVGGIYFTGSANNPAGTLSLQNSIIVNDTGGTAPDCYTPVSATSNITVTTGGHNLLGSAAGCPLTPSDTDILGQDPKLGMRVEPGYIPLLPGSPAVDAGSPEAPGSSATACEPFDSLGAGRPLDGNQDGTAVCDIGAFETPPTLPAAPAILKITGGESQTAVAGKSYLDPLTVNLRDQYGFPAVDVPVTFTAPESGASILFSENNHEIIVRTDASGIASSGTITANAATGQFLVTASVAGIEAPAQFHLENYMQVPAALAIFKGDRQVVNASTPFPIAFQVSVKDNYNRAIPDVLVTFTAPETGPGGTFADTGANRTTAITNASGIATATVFTANSLMGAYLLHAGVPQLADGIDFHLTNTGPGRYVDGVNGSDDTSRDCRSIAAPCKSVVRALTQAAAGEEIKITSGEYPMYNSYISTNRELIISGGWNTSFSARDGQTTLKGDTDAIVYVNNQARVKMDRVDLSVASTWGKYGIKVNPGGSLVFQNGAIRNADWSAVENHGNLELTNVTLSQNNCLSAGNGCGHAPALYNLDGGTAKLTNVTVAGNYQLLLDTDGYTFKQVGGIYNESGTVTIQNSIIANNRSNREYDCAGQITSLGHNLIGVVDGCTVTPAEGDRFGTAEQPLEPGLSGLEDHGGGTVTLALLENSPAVDAGDPSACPAVDQRQTPRPLGGACDIGAFEGAVAGLTPPEAITAEANFDDLPGYVQCHTPTTDCTGGSNPDADAAHAFALLVHAFYQKNFGRDSLDNAGMMILSSVSDGYSNNAAWNGRQIWYSKNYSRASDVVAHELTHGVTQYESNLFYFYQSGAINESLSDVFGEYFDQTDDRDIIAGDTRWLIGEDLQPTGGALRSMNNPPQFKNPDKMTSAYYYKGDADNGGVHTNSGINNKAAYLMVDGGTFNGKTVAPLGWEKTAAIYYYTQTHLLTSGSDYGDLYNDLFQACTALTGGPEGITAGDCTQVRAAADAVQMNLSPSPTFNPDAPYCPAGTTRDSQNLLYDGFEDGASGWTISAAAGNPRWSVVPGDTSLHYAAGGRYALFGNDYDESRGSSSQRSDSSAAMTAGIKVPSGTATYLHFKHAFAFEWGKYGTTTYRFDGGVLEYSTNGGASWVDAKPLFSAGQNYTGSIYNSTANGYNPLRGRAGFVGDSHGYVSSRYSLTSLAGKTVQFRWRIGTDYSGYYLGWLVDDVAVYTCVSNPAVPVPALPANGGLLPGYTTRLDWKDAASAQHYELQVARDKVFSDLVLNQTGLTTSEFTPPEPLDANMTYFWRVRAVNSLDVSSAWSPAWSFRTHLIMPVLSEPAPLTTVSLLRPTFAWAPSPGASNYTIAVSTSANLSSPVLTATVASTISEGRVVYRPIKDLPAGKTLYWHVRANGANPSLWSTTYRFTTPKPPSVPALSSPANNALLTNYDANSGGYLPVLKWARSTVPSGAPALKGYTIQVDDQADFTSPLVDLPDLTAVSFTFTAPVPGNQKLYWRVRACNVKNECSSWSARAFRTAILPPSLASPTQGQVLATTKPVFDWSDVEGASSYTILISAYANCSSPLVKATGAASSYMPGINLPKGKLLYWRVQANGPNGPSLPSSIQSFKIQ